MKKSISWKFVLGAFCSALLLGIGSQARAHNDGAIMWSKNGQPRGEGGHSWITYPSYQGAQGTHWVWRIQKYYPEFTVFCSTGHPSGCQANKTEGRFEQVMTQLTFKMELKGAFKAITGGVGFDVSKAWTKGSTFQIGQTIFMNSGYNAYAMIIALDKYIPAADWGGAWLPTGKVRQSCPSNWNYPCQPKEYEMRWNAGYRFATWEGHQITYARSYMCATRSTVEPKVGDGIPPGCSAPPIPY
ncbi:hypothetical protein [Variovorax sp. UMC13]|uniref:hypothetical protein n=1 Tax=Variovorax sp. UMC13 TaxID=1862326 RepID=UPI0016032B36|nr:hypothetical protein [Variovorax sp. UMC13]MBB1601303.1 hypothetical protein [Variovorax sp. UMC13]